MTEYFDKLSLEQKIGQLFFIGIPGPSVDPEAEHLLADVSPGGVCLFARNIKELSQTRELLDDLTARLPVRPFLSIDQEGGLVDRLRRVMTPMPAASKLTSAEQAAEQAAMIGETLRLLGFNMDFAPVVDVIDRDRAEFTNGLFSRTYGSSAAEVSQYARLFLDRLQNERIIGCLKHFPGLGAARLDSHEELPAIDISEAELEEVDLAPYRELIAGGGVRMVMAAHAVFPRNSKQEFSEDNKPIPTSLSYNFITGLLRGKLGFDGIVITDDLEMGAIMKNFGIAEACRLAIRAGVDMLAICADPSTIREGFDAVLESVRTGEISTADIDRSLARIAAVKSDLAEAPSFDLARLRALSDRTASLAAAL